MYFFKGNTYIIFRLMKHSAFKFMKHMNIHYVIDTETYQIVRNINATDELMTVSQYKHVKHT